MRRFIGNGGRASLWNTGEWMRGVFMGGGFRKEKMEVSGVNRKHMKGGKP